jgi:nucleoside-diphosphate-sugar epimerase
MGRRIAIVGGTGFIGSHLAEHLLDLGDEVLVVARSTRRASFLLDRKGISFEEADIVCLGEITSALKNFDPDTVFHLASEADGAECYDQMDRCIKANSTGTLNVMQAAIASDAKLFVYADSSKVYGNGPVPYTANQMEDPICSYAVAKAAGWKLCKLLAARSEIDVVGLRPTFVYGPRQNFNLISYIEQCVEKNQPIKIQGGRQTRDLLFVEDAVHCFATVMDSPSCWGHSLPIGGGREITVADLCREVLSVLESKVELILDGAPSRPTEIWRSYCDNLQVRQLTGWQPQVSLREGLRQTLYPGLQSVPVMAELRAIAS